MKRRRHTRTAALTAAVAAAVGAFAAANAVPASASRICTWGGTPANPTGIVTIDPGITNTPSAGPLRAHAWGPLEGQGCKGTMTFTGVARPGSSCLFSTFEGSVEGVPGVTRLFGAGSGPLVHEFLYDRDGNVVGSDQPLVKAFGAGGHSSDGLDCRTPEGYTRGPFSATLEFYK
jgi:hypothetical protein